MLPSPSPASSARLPASLSLYRPSQVASVLVATRDRDETQVATTKPSRAKTNSERGKEFRAKRKKYEVELETAVYKLRSHIAELDMRKTVWEKQFLDSRHTDSGSLAHLIREYFALFRYGVRDPTVPTTTATGNKRALVSSPPKGDVFREKIRKQEEFISSVMDCDAMVGDKKGPSASMAQWRLYTISHDSLRNEPYYITAAGSEDQPCIEVYTNIYGRISRDTIRYMFPGALHDEVLIQKFLHHEVVYKSIFRFQFTDKGKIALESADIGIVEGLQSAGFELEDISQLMQQTVLTPYSTIPEPSETECRVVSPPPASRGSPPPAKLSLNFLLGSEDELRADERVEELAP